MTDYGIDSHKLHLHPGRVARWLDGENIYPLYMEAAPAGGCNHRCAFCSMDYMGYQPRILDADMFKLRLAECGRLGVRAVMFGGEGEPLLNPGIAGLAEAARLAGLDVAFTTNAVLLEAGLSQRLLPVSSWIKASCNAGTAEKYASIHRAPAGDFEKVMANMTEAARLRARGGWPCVLGFQSLLLPDNAGDMAALARRARESGADYLTVKPYSRNPNSLANAYDGVSYRNTSALADELAAEERPGFRVIFRSEAMRRWDAGERPLDRCLALPFWVYVDSGGEVHGCLRHLRNERFAYGDLNGRTFEDIWSGVRRRENMAFCAESFDIRDCQVTCRMETINRYLRRLRRPEAHDNFI